MKNVKDILKINKEMGGKPLNTGSIEFALASGKEKSKYTQLAYLWRAILIDYPFDDKNKRTTHEITLRILKEMKIDNIRLQNSIIKVAKENIIDIKKLERIIRYAIEGK